MNDSFNVPLYVLFATISVDNSFILPADVSDVPFKGYVNIPFAAISGGAPFSLPIVGLGNPLDIILSGLNYFNPH